MHERFPPEQAAQTGKESDDLYDNTIARTMSGFSSVQDQIREELKIEPPTFGRPETPACPDGEG
jgi:hypothetical protein